MSQEDLFDLNSIFFKRNPRDEFMEKIAKGSANDIANGSMKFLEDFNNYSVEQMIINAKNFKISYEEISKLYIDWLLNLIDEICNTNKSYIKYADMIALHLGAIAERKISKELM